MAELSIEARASGPFSETFLAAAELIGRRWTGAIVYALAHGYDRFGALQSVVPGLSGRMLSQRLKELEDAGVVTRDVSLERPLRVTYTLTDKGDDLRSVFIALNRWSHRWADVAVATPASAGTG